MENEKAVQTHRTGETERSEAELGFNHHAQPCLRRRRRLGWNCRRQKGVRTPEVSLREKKGWFCDFRDHRWSSGLSFCHLRHCCRRRKSMPGVTDNPVLRGLYEKWLEQLGFDKAKRYFHTQYHPIEKNITFQLHNW
ncbi:hypothetical protein Ahy_B06g081709 [Arachis hypogaea]|uniref:Iron hydrogenase small subunit domain-containing protein n=1 Tax=Arachis hypogaea TaxID=3818 RepID=A0A444YLN4_ARAHY|nr:hypothetical protein Ahy_B06g081709 [Arachis hypogaea]